MTRNPLAVAACLAAIGLTACSPTLKTGGNAKLCADFKQAKGPLAADGAGPVEECVKRWAYSLAASRDDAETVADAAATACTVQLTRWNQQSLSQPGADGAAASLITGEPTTPLAEHNNFTRNRALFYVVQARAGSCPAPPITNGAPEGVG
jgi:hypothetical protein